MAEIALGWLGWSEEQLLHSDMNAIVVGYEGRQDMLRAIFGEAKEQNRLQPVRDREGKVVPLSPALFDLIAQPKGGMN